MKRLKWIIPLAVIVVIIASAAFVLSRGTVGYCIVADNNSRIIVVNHDPVVLSNRSLNKNALYKYDTGDKLLVLHDGIQESYPARTAAYLCFKIGEGSAKDIPADVFLGLYELNWLSQAYLEEIGIMLPDVEEEPPKEEGIDLVFDSYSPVSFSHGPYMMTLDIPEGWCFEEDADDYRQGIRFRPKGESDGWVGLYYHSGGFGVCGTGLESRELKLTNGFSGYVGYYDGNPLWSFITIDDADDYVFHNEGADWLANYEDEVFGIVASVAPEMIVTCVVPD